MTGSPWRLWLCMTRFVTSSCMTLFATCIFACIRAVTSYAYLKRLSPILLRRPSGIFCSHSGNHRNGTYLPEHQIDS